MHRSHLTVQMKIQNGEYQSTLEGIICLHNIVGDLQNIVAVCWLWKETKRKFIFKHENEGRVSVAS